MSIHASLLTIPFLKGYPDTHIGYLPLLERVFKSVNIVPTAEDWYKGFKHIHDCEDEQIVKYQTESSCLEPATRCVKYVVHPTSNIRYCDTTIEAFSEKQILEYMIDNDKHWSELFTSESEYLIALIRFDLVTSLKYSTKSVEHEVVLDETFKKKLE